MHLSLHERGRNRQLEAISGRLEELASRDLPIIIAGDFNDWRHRASAILERRLGMSEVSLSHHGKAARTFPSVLPFLRKDAAPVASQTRGRAKTLPPRELPAANES